MNIFFATMAYIGSSFLYWLKIFFIFPFENWEIFWIIIPVWINLIFSDFYQEKKGTDFGNAVSNGAAMLWVGIDWTRYTIRLIISEKLSFSLILVLKFFLCLSVLAFGFLIILFAIKGKNIAKKIGRVREVSYIMLVLSPLIYNLEPFTWKYFVIISVFFPVFYFTFEIIDRVLPDPKTYDDDSKMPPSSSYNGQYNPRI